MFGIRMIFFRTRTVRACEILWLYGCVVGKSETKRNVRTHCTAFGGDLQRCTMHLRNWRSRARL